MDVNVNIECTLLYILSRQWHKTAESVKSVRYSQSLENCKQFFQPVHSRDSTCMSDIGRGGLKRAATTIATIERKHAKSSMQSYSIQGMRRRGKFIGYLEDSIRLDSLE